MSAATKWRDARGGGLRWRSGRSDDAPDQSSRAFHVARADSGLLLAKWSACQRPRDAYGRLADGTESRVRWQHRRPGWTADRHSARLLTFYGHRGDA